MGLVNQYPTTERPAEQFTPKARGGARAWFATVLFDGREVWRSNQTYPNRDIATYTNLSAMYVARLLCRALNDPDGIKVLRDHQIKHGRNTRDAALVQWAIDSAPYVREVALAGVNERLAELIARTRG